MPITNDQKEKVTGMCPVAKEVDLGQLIRDAESGGMTAGTGLDITDGVISIEDGGVDTTQLAADAVTGDKVADDAIDSEHYAAGSIDNEHLADGAVTAAKLDSGIGLVTNPLRGPASGEILLRKTITLAGANPTNVSIAGADDAATLLGSTTETFNLTVGHTFIINPNGVGNQTWTVTGTAGTSTGATGCSEDMTASPDTKLKIAVDGGAAQTVTFNWAGCNSGALIAAQMQTAIRALGGDYSAVTVAFDTDHYLITSGNKGTASAVVITRADDHNCTEELKLGAADGGTETVGTGDAAILARATAAECAAKIDALHAQIAAAAESGAIRINATNTGGSSSLVVGNGTENAVLGFTNTQADYGNLGMGAGHEMANATYTVILTPVNNAPGTNPRSLSVYNKTTTGFDIYQENAAAIPCDVLVVGVLAS